MALAIRSLEGKYIKGIMHMMLEFPQSYTKDYVMSRKRGSIRLLLKYLLSLSSENFNEGGSYVLVDVKDKVIGHIAYLRDERCFEGGVYEIRGLVVDEDWQGFNLSSGLLYHVLATIKNLGGRIVWLQTEKKEMEEFYKKIGFKLTAVYKNYWGKGRNRYIMSVELEE